MHVCFSFDLHVHIAVDQLYLVLLDNWILRRNPGVPFDQQLHHRLSAFVTNRKIRFLLAQFFLKLQILKIKSGKHVGFFLRGRLTIITCEVLLLLFYLDLFILLREIRVSLFTDLIC